MTVKVSASTKIAQELQPRFVGGNPPDLIDNSGANQIGWNTILDQLETLDDVLDSNNLEGTKISDTLYGGVKGPGTFDGKFVALNYVMTVYGIWYSDKLFKDNGFSVPTSWQDLKALGEAAKAKGKYLFVWGKEAATYYQTLVVDSAVIQGGDDVRLPLENLKENCWSHPIIQDILNIFYELIQAGYMKPGGAGTQFTQAQSQWSLDQAALLYPSGSWIENEMKKQTADGFTMKGIGELPLDGNQKTPKGTLRAEAGEPFIVPSKAKNPRRRQGAAAHDAVEGVGDRVREEQAGPDHRQGHRPPTTASARRLWCRRRSCWTRRATTSSRSSRSVCTA